MADSVDMQGPVFTFLDPRDLGSADGRKKMVEQALAIMKEFETRGIEQSRVAFNVGFSIPELARNSFEMTRFLRRSKDSVWHITSRQSTISIAT